MVFLLTYEFCDLQHPTLQVTDGNDNLVEGGVQSQCVFGFFTLLVLLLQNSLTNKVGAVLLVESGEVVFDFSVASLFYFHFLGRPRTLHFAFDHHGRESLAR